MTNPWHRLPEQPSYVLPEDAELVARFNDRAAPRNYLHLDLIPEPFLGSPDAPVVLLTLNPGFSTDDREHHLDPEFIQRSRDNLLHRQSHLPLFLLDPMITAPGGNYWRAKLGGLTRELGIEMVARKSLVVEFIPYHSVKFGHARLRLPSQQYSFALVDRAIDRGAIVVIMRGQKEWEEAVPKLRDYSKLHRLNSRQNVTVTQKNCPRGFGEICEAISKN